jgi:valyl-tRNA synthetase
MPFVTEEIWQHVRRTGSRAARRLSGWETELPESVMIAPWPISGPPDERAESETELIMEMVREVRTIRSEYGVDPGKYISATVAAGLHVPVVAANADTIRRLARLQPLALYQVLDERPPRAVTLLVGEVAVYLPLDELTDVEAERARLAKELDGARRHETSTESKLSNESFTSRAPAEVVERERERIRSIRDRIRRLEERLEALDD